MVNNSTMVKEKCKCCKNDYYFKTDVSTWGIPCLYFTWMDNLLRKLYGKDKYLDYSCRNYDNDYHWINIMKWKFGG